MAGFFERPKKEQRVGGWKGFFWKDRSIFGKIGFLALGFLLFSPLVIGVNIVAAPVMPAILGIGVAVGIGAVAVKLAAGLVGAIGTGVTFGFKYLLERQGFWKGRGKEVNDFLESSATIERHVLHHNKAILNVENNMKKIFEKADEIESGKRWKKDGDDFQLKNTEKNKNLLKEYGIEYSESGSIIKANIKANQKKLDEILAEDDIQYKKEEGGKVIFDAYNLKETHKEGGAEVANSKFTENFVSLKGNEGKEMKFITDNQHTNKLLENKYSTGVGK